MIYKTHPLGLWVSLVSALVLAGPLGCGDRPPEARLAQAGEALEEREAEVAAARERVDALRARAQELRRELRASERELHVAEAALLTAAERVERRATDAAVFRAVQSALFEDERLEDEFVVALVEDGAVTLAGFVSSEDERSHALTLARGVVGVDVVHDWLDVDAAESEAENDHAEG